MARRQAEEVDFGDVPFLDTLCNIVGILIALIMIVGILSGQAPASALRGDVETAGEPEPEKSSPEAPASPPSVAVDLNAPAAELQQLTYDFKTALVELQRHSILTQARDAERGQMAMDVAAGKKLLDDRKKQLDEAGLSDLALAQEAAALEAQLDRLDQDLGNVQDLPPEVVALKHEYTPISQTVYGEELHFRLHGSKLAALPIDRLAAAAKREVERQISRLKPGEPIESTVGPINDFRMNFTIEMKSVTGPNGQTGTITGVSKWQMEPVRPDIGEPIEVALAGTSRFRTELAKVNPRRAAITIWVYPDSFASFRLVKEELAKLGYSCAARPLPFNQLISGSPQGSRSNAQ